MEQNVQNELAELVKLLPKKIRQRANVEVIAAAIEENLLRITEDKRLMWLSENKTLLAYFCGRMWCGDSTHYYSDCRSWMWERGKVMFPEKDLNFLFGVRNLRTLRKNRDLCIPPKGWELVERIFKIP